MRRWKLLLVVTALIIAFAIIQIIQIKPVKPSKIALVVVVEGRGWVRPSTPIIGVEPFNVTLEAVPDEHSLFRYWIVNGSAVSGEQGYVPRG